MGTPREHLSHPSQKPSTASYWVQLADRGGPRYEVLIGEEVRGWPDDAWLRILNKCGITVAFGFTTTGEACFVYVDLWY